MLRMTGRGFAFCVACAVAVGISQDASAEFLNDLGNKLVQSGASSHTTLTAFASTVTTAAQRQQSGQRSGLSWEQDQASGLSQMWLGGSRMVVETAGGAQGLVIRGVMVDHARGRTVCAFMPNGEALVVNNPDKSWTRIERFSGGKRQKDITDDSSIRSREGQLRGRVPTLTKTYFPAGGHAAGGAASPRPRERTY